MNTIEKNNEIQTMTEDQMAMAAAGCWLGGRFGTHHLIPYEGFYITTPNGIDIEYDKMECKDCHKYFFLTHINGGQEEITEAEYKRAKMIRGPF